MIDGYGRNEEITSAMELFVEMPGRDASSWIVFIDGFVT